MKSISVIMAMAMMVVTMLSGCVTRTSREWGYNDLGGPSVTTSPPVLSPVNPANNTVRLPNGQVVPAQPGAVYPVNPVAPQYNNYSSSYGNGRATYEHNREEFDVNSVLNAVSTIGTLFFMTAAGASIIDGMAHPHKYGHRYYRRW